MNLNESEQTRKKLEQEYNDNCEKIDEINKKIYYLSSNRFENKVMRTFTLSILPMVGCLALMPVIYKYVPLPFNVLQPLTFSVPILIGFVGESILSEKRKYKEKLKSFSSAKCEQDLLKEQTQYEIEKEKLKSQNRVLKKTYNDIESNGKILISLSDKYNITEKNNEENMEEINNTIISLNKELEENKKQIDISTTKKELNNKFWKCREKFSFADVILNGWLVALMLVMYYNMPFLYVNNNVNLHIDLSLIDIMFPTIIGGLIAGGYEIINRKNRKTVFRNVNDSLGENSISEEKNYEENIQFEKDLDKKINATCAIRIKLEEAKQRLENLQKIENKINETKKNKDSVINMSINKEIEQSQYTGYFNEMDENIYSDEINDDSIVNENVNEEKGPVLKKTLNSEKML